ncbi:MAG: murein biosynthesis integral membrane protein MurJ [Kineosporiaceae bacterium]
MNTPAGRCRSAARRGIAPAVLATLLVTILTVLAILAPAVAGASSAAGATAGASALIELTSSSSASITPGSTYVLSGVVRNTGRTPLRSLSVRMHLDWPRLTGPEIVQWAARSRSERLGVTWATQTLPGELAAGGSMTFALTGAADDLGLPIEDGFGPRGLAVEVLADNGSGVQRWDLERTFVVWDPSRAPGAEGAATGAEGVATRVAVLAPLTPLLQDASSDAGTPSGDLVRQWQPGGRLSRILQATADRSVAWAIDPSLITAALTAQGRTATRPAPSGAGATTGAGTGNASPGPSPGATSGSGAGTPGTGTVDSAQAATARSWLDAVAAASADRDLYALPWGDPDLAALAHAQAGELLAAARDDAVQAGRAVWNRPLDTSLAWPVDGLADESTISMLDDVLGAAATPGATADASRGGGAVTAPAHADVVLSSASIPPRTSPEALASGRIEAPGATSDAAALLTDPYLNTALAAVAAPGAASFLAQQQTLALLAAHAVGGTAASPAGVLAALPRDWDPAQPEVFATVLAQLAQVPWIHVEPVGTARRRAAGPAPATLIGGKVRREVPQTQVLAVRDAFHRLSAFRPVLVQPQISYQPARRSALSLVGRSWRGLTATGSERDVILTRARAPLVRQVDRYYASISVVTGNAANLVSTSGRLPVTVTNTLPEPVSVVVALEPRSRRLRVGDPQPVSLGAATTGPARAGAFIDVTAVANGDVDLDPLLYAPGGTAPLVRSTGTIRVRVRHDWEGRALAGAGAVLAVLLLVGLRRSVRGGRRLRIPLDQVPDPDDVALIAAGERVPTPPLGLSRAGVTGAAPRATTVVTPSLITPPLVTTPLPSPAVTGDAGSDDGRTSGSGPGPGNGSDPRHATDAGSDAGAGSESGADSSSARSMMRSSALMSAGTLVSRILGWVRASVLSAAIGGALSGSVFATANTLPNNVFILIGGGALNAILVPQIVRAAKQSDDGGTEYIDRLLTLATLILGAATVLATAAAPLLIRLYSDNWDRPTLDLGTAMAVWCLPQIFFYGLYTLYGQVLNARGSFGPYMWAPVVNNIVAIAGMVVFIALAGSGERPVTGWSAADVALLAGTATLGVVANALVLVPVMRRAGYVWRPRWGWRGIGLRNAGTIALWTFAGVALAQLGFLVISRVVNAAGTAAQRDGIPAGRAVFDFAFMIFMMPHSLVAVSVVTAVFTRLSARAAEGDLDAVRADLSLALRTVSVATMFATAIFIALGPLITAGMFPGTNRVTTDQYALVATAMLLGIVPFSAQFLFQRVSYAFEDARTPFWIGTLGTLLSTVGALLVPTVLAPRDVAAGIGAVMAATYLITTIIWFPVLRRRLGSVDGPRILSTHLRLLLAAASAIGIGILVREGAQVVLGERGVLGVYGVLGSATVVMSITYLLALRALRVDELDTLLQPIRSRLSR